MKNQENTLFNVSIQKEKQKNKENQAERQKYPGGCLQVCFFPFFSSFFFFWFLVSVCECDSKQDGNYYFNGNPSLIK